MSDLSPKCRSLIEAAREARPKDVDRIRAGIAARVGLAAAASATATVLYAKTAAGATSAAAPSAAAKVAGMGLVAKIVLGCVITSALVFGGHAILAPSAPVRETARHLPLSERTIATMGTPNTPEVASTTSDAEADDPPSLPDAPDPTPVKREAPRARVPNTKGASDSVSIAAEVALLREAQAALTDGDAARSLSAIDALAARHPDGVLREEREAARVLALCAAGRVDEARAQGLRFLAQTPKSVQAARVRASCAFVAPTKK